MNCAAGGQQSLALTLLQLAATFSNFAEVSLAANLSGWNSTTTHAPCAWSRTACDLQGNLISLDLSSLGLQGAPSHKHSASCLAGTGNYQTWTVLLVALTA